MSKSFRASLEIWNETEVIRHIVNHRVFYLRRFLRSNLKRIETVLFSNLYVQILRVYLEVVGRMVVKEIYRLMFSFFSENRGTVNTLKRGTFSKKSVGISFMKRRTKPKRYYFIENHLKFCVL